MPFAREYDEHRSAGDGDGSGEGGAAENALPFGDIENLEFIQDSPAFFGKKIAGRMTRGRVRFSGADVLETYGVYGKAPEEVVPVDGQVFQVDVFVFHIHLRRDDRLVYKNNDRVSKIKVYFAESSLRMWRPSRIFVSGP
jgi:hypothetical protein